MNINNKNKRKVPLVGQRFYKIIFEVRKFITHEFTKNQTIFSHCRHQSQPIDIHNPQREVLQASAKNINRPLGNEKNVVKYLEVAM